MDSDLQYLVILDKAKEVFGSKPEWKKIDNLLRIKLWGEPENAIWKELLSVMDNDEAFENAIIDFQKRSEKRASKAQHDRNESLRKRWRDTTDRKMMSQKDFCKKYEIDESAFHNWINGETNESLKTERAVQLFLADVRM